VLLDLSAEDLDFVGVPVLAHRKLLLRGVQQLRESAGSAAIAGGVPGAAGTAAAPIPLASPPPAASVMHWSHMQPLPGPKVSSSTDTALDASSTSYAITQVHHDGNNGSGSGFLDGTYDEEAQALAFKAAVEAWRSGRKLPHVPKEADSCDNGSTTDTGALWQNPLGGNLSGPTSIGPMRFGAPATRDASPPGGKRESLADGALDEEAEAAAFREAVREWRQTTVGGLQLRSQRQL